MRDSQKSKVYAWEREVVPGFWAQTSHTHVNPDPARKPMTIPQCQAYASEVARAYGRTVRVVAGRGGGYAYWGGTIRLGVQARSKGVILHEVAHVLTNDHHGPEFVRVFIDLLARWLGLDAVMLRATARAARIRVATRKAAPKPKLKGKRCPKHVWATSRKLSERATARGLEVTYRAWCTRCTKRIPDPWPAVA